MSEHHDSDEGSDDLSDSTNVTYGLVMPFVVCKTQGGPFDDLSFVAGCSFAEHMAELRAAPHIMSWSAYVVPEMVPQYDLLAMHHGFTMKAEPWDEHPDDWQLVIFTKDGPDDV